MNDSAKRTTTMNVFSLLLYIFSALALASGALLFLLLLGASRSVANSDLFFQLGGLQQLAPLVLRPLQAALINTGVVLFVLLLTIAVLLFAAGRLVTSSADLAKRVRALEDKIKTLTPDV